MGHAKEIKGIYEGSSQPFYHSKYILNVHPWEIKYGAFLYIGILHSFNNDD